MCEAGQGRLLLWTLPFELAVTLVLLPVGLCTHSLHGRLADKQQHFYCLGSCFSTWSNSPAEQLCIMHPVSISASSVCHTLCFIYNQKTQEPDKIQPKLWTQAECWWSDSCDKKIYCIAAVHCFPILLCDCLCPSTRMCPCSLSMPDLVWSWTLSRLGPG